MTYDDIAISDSIEWITLVFLIVGLMLLGAYYIEQRIAAHYKKAGSTTMAESTSKIKALFSTPKTEERPAAKVIPLSEVLTRQGDDQVALADAARKNVEHHTQMATAATTKAEEADRKAAAIQQAKAILEQAGL